MSCKARRRSSRVPAIGRYGTNSRVSASRRASSRCCRRPRQWTTSFVAESPTLTRLVLINVMRVDFGVAISSRIVNKRGSGRIAWMSTSITFKVEVEAVAPTRILVLTSQISLSTGWRCPLTARRADVSNGSLTSASLTKPSQRVRAAARSGRGGHPERHATDVNTSSAPRSERMAGTSTVTGSWITTSPRKSARPAKAIGANGATASDRACKRRRSSKNGLNKVFSTSTAGPAALRQSWPIGAKLRTTATGVDSGHSVAGGGHFCEGFRSFRLRRMPGKNPAPAHGGEY
jgi:hypothetical protein